MAKTTSIFALLAFMLFLLQPSLAFWRLQCFGVVARGQIDPIMSPGEVSGHVHSVKGPNTFGDNATYEDLLASTCTSCEVKEDHSAYWEPQLYFFSSNGTVSAVSETPGHLTYYKYVPVFTSNGTYANPEPMPNGLRMISGNALRRNFSLPVPDPALPWSGSDATQDALAQKAIGFNCLNYAKAPEPSLYRHTLPNKAYLDANCPDGLRVELLFPYCWNGALDSPDHKSHLAFPDANLNGGHCPAGYDRVINQLFFETIYPTADFVGQDGFFAFAMGDPTGCGMHGDVIIAWEGDVLAQATAQCGPLSGPDASGLITDCPLFTVLDQGAQQACQIPDGNSAAPANVVGGLKALPGNNPLQYGPQQATMMLPGAPAQSKPTAAPTPSVQPTAQSAPTDSSGTTTLMTSTSAPPAGTTVTTISTAPGGTVWDVVLIKDIITVYASAPTSAA